MTATLTERKPKAPAVKAPTLTKRMDAMEQGYGIKYLAYDGLNVDLWQVGLVILEGEHAGEFDPKHVYTVAAIENAPQSCRCFSRETICKHKRFLSRHLNADKQRGPCPTCAAQERGGVLFSERRQFAGGSIYYLTCDVCDYERALL